MTGIYFSGTGNTKYCIERFVAAVDKNAKCFPIERPEAIEAIKANDVIIVANPICFSNISLIMRNFINAHGELFRGKKVYVIATMGLWSGDGAGCTARLLKKHGAKILGGLHLYMPDSVGDTTALKRPLEKNKERVRKSEKRIDRAAKRFTEGKPTKNGLYVHRRFYGLITQRLWFRKKAETCFDNVRINAEKCTGCGKCVKDCPTGNLKLVDGIPRQCGKCVLCYRCFSNCPGQAINLMFNKMVEQCKIENCLDK